MPFRAYFSSLGLNFLICQWTDNLWICEAIFVTTLRNRNCKMMYRLGQKQYRGAMIVGHYKREVHQALASSDLELAMETEI